MSETSPGATRLFQLWLPDLAGRSVLDIGVNDGLYRSFAQWSGAAQVIGIDDPQALSGSERFDVILLASSLPSEVEYEPLVDALVSKLTPRGVLIVDTQFLLMGDGTDGGGAQGEPPGEELRAYCKDKGFTFRFVWRSDSHPGSTVRHDVFHIGRPLLSAWLLLAPSTSGKTTKAQRLAHMPNTVHVRTDRVLAEALANPESVPAALQGALTGIHPWTLNLAYDAIVDGHLEGELARLLLSRVPDDCEPVLDLYLPEEGHQRFIDAMTESGFNPVLLTWPHPIAVDDDDVVAARLAAFTAREPGEDLPG